MTTTRTITVTVKTRHGSFIESVEGTGDTYESATLAAFNAVDVGYRPSDIESTTRDVARVLSTGRTIDRAWSSISASVSA